MSVLEINNLRFSYKDKELFNDLNAKECIALYKIIFEDYTGRGWQPRYELHNPIDRENLKQVFEEIKEKQNKE